MFAGCFPWCFEFIVSDRNSVARTSESIFVLLRMELQGQRKPPQGELVQNRSKWHPRFASSVG